MFTPAEDPDEVAIDFYFSRVYDQSAFEAINTLSEKYQKLGKKLHLRHLSPECQDILKRAGNLVDIDIATDPHYHLSVHGFPNEAGRRRAQVLKDNATEGPRVD